MRTLFLLLLLPLAAQAQNPFASNKITPGKVIVPTDKMRRIWGELVSVDLKTRTGTFRNEGTDEIMPFTVMPYAELLHKATFGDLHDYKIGERAIFRMHENADGQWVWLTYIQDEMNFLNGHKEYYWIDKLEPKTGQIEITQANFNKSFLREKGILLETDADTRFWKDGKPAKFSDLEIGQKIRTKTHGVGKGKVRRCWEVFLDDDSLLKMQAEQMAVHRERMLKDGLPGYIDERNDSEVKLTLFQEGREVAKELKAGSKIQVALAGVDRKANSPWTSGTVAAMQPAGNLYKATLRFDAPPPAFPVGSLARVLKQ